MKTPRDIKVLKVVDILSYDWPIIVPLAKKLGLEIHSTSRVFTVDHQTKSVEEQKDMDL